MDPSFIPVEVAPSKTPFGLDQLRRSYKTPLSAEAAIAAAPAVGTADEVFPFMFLMPVTTPESAESATRIDLVYIGAFADDGADGPLLPAGKHESDVNPASATGQYAGAFNIGAPVTVQFYAPSNSLTWISTSAGGLGPSGDVDDPPDDPVIIAFTFTNDSIPFGFTGDIQVFWLANMFTILITETLRSEEIVPGQYWQNTKRKTKVYIPLSTIA